ncbi:MAG TPA: deoxynucleoside kinase [Chromatiaceae bacterium]|nr:deoxynucleoside kinase [Chromatiaceae bacterium]HIB84926.1 deoxynucleoside kinase [Chromatiaceae bacterium]HIN82952.1 deoxynucleoside kinase [Chromatiales bacterium]HIO14233.1 deoxynucleoside kinase [Chromatiales bacterium]HIO54573.1 deoxynucleoside kinase [Chromatiales bacterium]
MELPGYVVIEGPIGVGKTSLTRRLAERFECESLLEGVDDNPFLERFYQDQSNVALQTQLFFLFQRVQQIQALHQGDLFRSALVSDFALEKDQIFAQLTLQSDELDLYEQVYAKLAVDPPMPDLMIYLQASVDVLYQRIASRGREWEQRIDRDYLERLVEHYAQFFHDYSASPLLIVNAELIDPVSNDEDFELLAQQICSISHGRQYFNPAALGF